jgi:formamidopyrimidine-DNA glycosylase
MFGKIRYFDKEPDLDLGPDPLAPDFTFMKFKGLLDRKKTTLKTLLMDQKFLSGVGNIYAAEILFRAGIHPQRKSDDLSEAEMEMLHEKIREVLQDGIKYRGTSDSWYVDARGKKGDFQNHLKVYGRKGEPCVRCKTPIQRISLGQRGTYFCPRCQK